MRARVPCSTANLGPGFDTLALALDRHIEVEIESAESLEIVSEGEGSDLARDEDHLAVRVARSVVGHDRLSIKISSDIPMGRGLGSSAALTVAVAAASGAEDPLTVAAEFEGHPENAAASVMGGLVTATMVDERVVATPLFLDPDLHFVLLIPDRTLSTKDAREALPKMVSLEDAVFNLGRLAWLIASLGDASGLTPEVMHDRLHTSRSMSFFPESRDLLDSMLDAGASAACWSGAGPSLLGLCVGGDRAQRVLQAAEKAMETADVPGVVQVLSADQGGLQVE